MTLLGRGTSVINTGGEKVYPEEVDDVVKTMADVDDCLVVGMPDERFGPAVTAVVQLRAGAPSGSRRSSTGCGPAWPTTRRPGAW